MLVDINALVLVSLIADSFCESPIDWCSLGVCGNRNCTNNSTLSQGYSCGACSTGYELSGTKCRGKLILCLPICVC